MSRWLCSIAIVWFPLVDLFCQRILPVGTGIGAYGTVQCLVEHQGLLIIGGQYTAFNDHQRPNLQGWNGTVHFDLSGAFEAVSDRVNAMVVHQGDLIAAGRDQDFGHIARWDGNSWGQMGSGYPGTEVHCLVVHADTLIAGGANGGVQRWNGTSWEPMDMLFTAAVNALTVHEDQLYAGTLSGQLFRWDGWTWIALNNDSNGPVHALLSTPSGLLVGGGFSSWNGETLAEPFIVLWNDNTFTAPGITGPGATVAGLMYTEAGRLIVGASTYGSLIFDAQGPERITMFTVRAVRTYMGVTYVGGSSYQGSNDPLAFGVLVDGLDLARLDANNIGVDITHSPVWFGRRRGPGSPTFNVPEGSPHTYVDLMNPLFTGKAEGVDWFNGAAASFAAPCTGPNSTASGFEFAMRYQQVWKVDRSMIEHHQAHWMDPDHVIPHAIATWPGNGSVDDGEPQLLAPFVDLNGNGIYEPEQGDHPAIRGDQAIYYIQHDPDVPGSFAYRAGLDRHVMHYAFWNSWNDALFNTVFTNVKLVNRSDRTYTDARFGTLGSFRIGCPEDDLLGCDPVLGSTYMYNGTPTDAGCDYAIDGVPPAIGITWLNTPLTVNLRLTTPGNVSVEPIIAEHAANLLRGLQPDGSPMLDPDGLPVTLAFPGDPVTNTGWVDGPVAPASPAKIHVSATGPFTLAPGDTLCADIAWIHARDSVGGHLASVTLLKQYTAAIRQWYQDNDIQCSGSYGIVTGQATLPVREDHRLQVHPNPTADRITVRTTSDAGPAVISVHDATGRVLLSSLHVLADGIATLDLAHLPNGSYIVLVHGRNGISSGRVMLIR